MLDWQAGPPSAWRIDKEKWAPTSFEGRGAALEGGRWNPPGLPVVYLSENLAMSAMEKLVHLPKPLGSNVRYVKIPVWFDPAWVEVIAPENLPPDWDIKPVRDATQRLGAAWWKEKRSALLQVPSAIIPSEKNFLLNPTHADFARVKIGPTEPFAFDPRLLRS
jgi:RES domain-containing protein